MIDQRLDIDAIVREVLRRLEMQESGGAAQAGRGKAPVEPRDAERLRIDSRVVTLATLQDRVAGAKTVAVPVGAVVTPAVKDFLRERKIALVWEAAKAQTAEAEAANPDGLLVGVAVKPGVAGAVTAALAREFRDLQIVQDDCPVAVTRQVIRQVAECDRLGVLLSDEPVAALCAANRWGGVQAVWGVSMAAIGQSLRTIGANLLIIDPTAHNVYEVRSMVRRFACGRRDKSDRWKKLLE